MSKNRTYSLWKSLLGLVFLLGMTQAGYGQGGITYTIVPAQCNGASSGSINVILSENNDCAPGPYQYQLVGPYPVGSLPNAGTTITTLPATTTSSLSQLFTGLASGLYNINILINGVLCTGVEGANVSQPPAIVVTQNVTQPTCNQANAVGNNYLGSAVITINGGSTGTCVNNCRGYNLQWSGPTAGGSLNGCPKEIITCSQSAGTNTFTMSNLPGGTYNISIEDNNNCPASTSFTITQPSAINVTNTLTNVPCNGGTGSILVSPTGGTPGYNVTWGGISSGNPSGNTPETVPYNITPLGVGNNYSVTVTDANGCSATQNNIAITQPPALQVTSSTTPVLCFNGTSGTATFMVLGGVAGYNVSWTGPTPGSPPGFEIAAEGGSYTAPNLAAGNYVFTITDNGGGCSATVNVTITQPSAALAVSTTAQNILCFGANNGSILVYGTGGTPQGNNPQSGYHVSWSGQSSGPPGALTAAIEIPTSNPSIISGYYTIGPLSPGNYTVTLTDAKNCTSQQNITITQPPQMFLAETHVNNVCHGDSSGSINLTVSGPAVGINGGTPYSGPPPYYNYSWTSSCGFVSNIQDPVNIPGACTLGCLLNFPSINIRRLVYLHLELYLYHHHLLRYN